MKRRINYIQKAKVIFIILSLLLSMRSFSQEHEFRFDHVTIDDGLSQNTISGIVKDKYGFMWFGTFNGLNRYDGYKITIYKNVATDSTSISNNRIYKVYLDENKNVCIYTFDKLINRYNYETDNFTRLGKAKSELEKKLENLNISAKYKNFQFTAKDGGILCLNQINNTQFRFKADLTNPFALHDGIITELYQDNTNLLWVAGNNFGVNKVDLQRKAFQQIDINTIKQKINLETIFRSINTDRQGNLWLGTNWSGICVINSQKNTYENINYPFLPSAAVRCLYFDKEGIAWIGFRGGFARYNPKTKQLKKYVKGKESGLTDENVYQIMEDSWGNIWIGTFGGIGRYIREKDKFKMYNVSNGILKENSVRAVIEDHEKNLWVGTELGGVVKILRGKNPNDTAENLTPVFLGIENKDRYKMLTNNRIFSIVEDEQNNIWLATSAGVVMYKSKENSFSEFNEKNGLPDNMIVGLLSDGKGHIWFSHKRGLSRINILSLKIKNYTVSDGLQDNEFSEGAVYKAPDGLLYFGGIRGVNYFYPDSVQDNPYKPYLAFTELQILNKPVKFGEVINGRVILKKPLYLTDKIVLTHHDRIFSIEFAALHYSNPKANKYAYQLEGFDKTWIYTDASNRKITYTNLDDGTYILKMKGANPDGVWNENYIKLTIVVLPPWWATWWFRLIAILSIILSAVGYYRYKVNILKQHKRLLEQKVKERTAELVEANFELKEKQEEIMQQNEEITQQTEELFTQAELLAEQNKKLVELDKFKETITGSIVHDLKNPLNSIIVLSEIMQSYQENPEDLMNLKMMNQSGKMMLHLVMNILDAQKLENAKMQVDILSLPLNEVIANSLTQVPLLLEQKSIEVEILVAKDFQIQADKNLMTRVFTNLITNAIKFTPKGGVITFGTKELSPQMSTFYIKDTGCGINSKKLATIFDKFSQAEARDLGNTKSTGLGLNFCKLAIEAHGGKIWVESEVGVGSTFFISLKKVL